jgi:hypothetical protein
MYRVFFFPHDRKIIKFGQNENTVVNLTISVRMNLLNNFIKKKLVECANVGHGHGSL